MPYPKAIAVSPLEDYTLSVRFDNGECRLFDVKPYIRGSWFSELKNPEAFNTVKIDGLSIAWEGGQDIAPDCLYAQSVPHGSSIP